MRIPGLLLLLISFQAFAQLPPDPGKLVADPGFCTSQTASLMESEFGLKPICESTNEIEIRFWAVGLPVYDIHLTILAYHKTTGWNAVKYFMRLGSIRYDSSQKIPVTITPLSAFNRFDSLFENLKSQGIFTLPDMDELNIKNYILDGTNYSVAFKAGDQYRRYTFNNPGALQKRNKKIMELRNFSAIADLFYSSFTETK
ncbi:MAG: hypothetical protein IPP93_02415 [Chitinophagaceae bacterium]|nr:hypothetical protein [Chitinophagaceae bacterium]